MNQQAKDQVRQQLIDLFWTMVLFSFCFALLWVVGMRI